MREGQFHKLMHFLFSIPQMEFAGQSLLSITIVMVSMWLPWVGSETHHIMLPLFLLSPHLLISGLCTCRVCEGVQGRAARHSCLFMWSRPKLSSSTKSSHNLIMFVCYLQLLALPFKLKTLNSLIGLRPSFCASVFVSFCLCGIQQISCCCEQLCSALTSPRISH